MHRQQNASGPILSPRGLKRAGTELRDRVCAERLVRASQITPGDAVDPTLNKLEGLDVCASGPLSIDYWFRMARALWPNITVARSPKF